MPRLIRVARVAGIDIHLHWSAVVLVALLLFSGLETIERMDVTVAAVMGYLGVLLIHEWGHVIAARRRRCAVWDIRIYPLWGLTRMSAPASRLDASVIAWGGVLAQAAVALPIVAWVMVAGPPTSERTSAVLGLLSYFSLCVAAFNLIPARPLDGATAWQIVPILFRRAVLGRTATRRQRTERPRRWDR